MSAQGYVSVYVALADHVEKLAESLGLPVSMPNVSFEAPLVQETSGEVVEGDREAYLSMTFTPNTSTLVGLSFDSDFNNVGVLQVSVFWPSDKGLVKPMEVAAAVADAFEPGTVISRDGVQVNIDEAPVVAGSLQESDLVQVPVTVRWRACVPN